METTDGVTHKTRSTPTEPNGAQGIEPPDPNSGIRPTEVRRSTREGLKATSCQIKLGKKMQMSPSGPRSICSEANKVISTFSFDPSLEPYPQNLYQGEASGPPKSVFGTAWASIRR